MGDDNRLKKRQRTAVTQELEEELVDFEFPCIFFNSPPCCPDYPACPHNRKGQFEQSERVLVLFKSPYFQSVKRLIG